MPFADWMRGPLHDVVMDALDPAVARRRGLLDPAVVGSLRDRFSRNEIGWAEPWLLMMLELWCREVFDTAGTRAGSRRHVHEGSVVRPGALAAAADRP